MAGRGGRRVGAGAPTDAATTAKVKAAQSAASRFQERAAADFDRIYNALADLAFGVWVQDVGIDGKVRVYQRIPDRGALQTLIEHLKGKAAVAAVSQPDQSITFIAGHVPRPPKEKTKQEEVPDERADDGENLSEL